MESATGSMGANGRRRPLETCSVSISSIARISYEKIRNLDGAVGSITRKVFGIVLTISSLVPNLMRSHLLAIIAIADDHILAVEEIVQNRFPSSRFLFNKMDDLLVITERLPAKLEKVLKNPSGNFSQVVISDWILVYVISWLEFSASVLTRWRDEKAKVKEIEVDESFDQSLPLEEENEANDTEVTVAKRYSYKEALEKGINQEDRNEDLIKQDDRNEDMIKQDDRNEDLIKQEDRNEDLIDKEHRNDDDLIGKEHRNDDLIGKEDRNEDLCKENNGGGGEEGDTILELFETGWVLNPLSRSRGSSNSLNLSRSDSCV